MTEPRRVVLLDLDGTLTESGPGIIKCVIKAFEAVDVPVPNDEALQRFIGPAIIDSMKLNGIPPQKLDEAVRVYRHFYGDANVFNDPNEPGRKVPGRLVNSMYEGIPEQLRKMREMGYYLAVCTAKPEYQAIPIYEHFHLTELVDGIFGPMWTAPSSMGSTAWVAAGAMPSRTNCASMAHTVWFRSSASLPMR